MIKTCDTFKRNYYKPTLYTVTITPIKNKTVWDLVVMNQGSVGRCTVMATCGITTGGMWKLWAIFATFKQT